MSAEAQPAVDIAALTRRMVQGDEAGYRMFYELYFHRLFRYLLVVTSGREEAAREALQLALLRVVRHIRKFDSEEAVWSWLTVLARSAVVDEQRKRGRYLSFLDRWFQREQVEALHAGVEVVWVLYPRDRTIHVFESSHKAQILEAEEMLEAPSLLPGFSVRVSEFFV